MNCKKKKKKKTHSALQFSDLLQETDFFFFGLIHKFYHFQNEYFTTRPCLLRCVSAIAHHHTPEMLEVRRVTHLNLVKLCTIRYQMHTYLYMYTAHLNILRSAFCSTAGIFERQGLFYSNISKIDHMAHFYYNYIYCIRDGERSIRKFSVSVIVSPSLWTVGHRHMFDGCSMNPAHPSPSTSD